MKKRARTKKPAKVKASTKSAPKSAAKTGKTYTPTPIQGIGWAPFRYPLS
ncbi:MAG TPA: hypothetical protein VGL14_07605 [Methylomirabilota bacterium]